jgi:hypothetical protein
MQNTKGSSFLCDPVHKERWVAFGHMHFAIFVLDGSDLTLERITADSNVACEQMRQVRLKNRFRIFSRAVSILIYSADQFDPEVIDYVMGARIRRGRYSAHFVLYDICANRVVFREAAQNETLLYFPRMDECFDLGLTMLRQSQKR